MAGAGVVVDCSDSFETALRGERRLLRRRGPARGGRGGGVRGPGDGDSPGGVRVLSLRLPRGARPTPPRAPRRASWGRSRGSSARSRRWRRSSSSPASASPCWTRSCSWTRARWGRRSSPRAAGTAAARVPRCPLRHNLADAGTRNARAGRPRGPRGPHRGAGPRSRRARHRPPGDPADLRRRARAAQPPRGTRAARDGRSAGPAHARRTSAGSSPASRSIRPPRSAGRSSSTTVPAW